MRKPCWRRGARAKGLEMGEFARALLLQQEFSHPHTINLFSFLFLWRRRRRGLGIYITKGLHNLWFVVLKREREKWESEKWEVNKKCVCVCLGISIWYAIPLSLLCFVLILCYERNSSGIPNKSASFIKILTNPKFH